MEPTTPSKIVALFGLNVRLRRLQRGFTQEKVAFSAGIAFNYLSGIERGKHNPSLKTSFRIAKALGVQIIELFAPLPPDYVPPKNLPRGRNVHHQGRRPPKARRR